MKSKLALFTALALVAGSAVAADSGFYVGAGMGYSSWNVNDGRLDNNIDNSLDSLTPPANLEVGSSKTNQTATPWELYVGYRFNKYFATELGWMENGGSTYKGQVVTILPSETFPVIPAGTNVGTVKGTRTANGWPVTVLGIYPINDSWEVFARAGAYFGNVNTKARVVLSDGTSVWQGHDNGNSTTSFTGGLGVNYNFMDTWTARGEWLAISSFGDNRNGSGNLNAFMASIAYRF
jgi:opacity protein-like surface antigen